MDTQIYSYRKVPFKELLFSQKLESIIFQTGFWINVNLRIPVIIGIIINIIKDIQGLYFVYYDFAGIPDYVAKVVNSYVHFKGIIDYNSTLFTAYGIMLFIYIIIGLTALIYSITKKEKNSILYKILAYVTLFFSKIVFYYGIIVCSIMIYVDSTGYNLQYIPEIPVFSIQYIILLAQFILYIVLFIPLHLFCNMIFNTPTLYSVKNSLNTNYSSLDNYKLIFCTILIFIHPFEKLFLKTNFYSIFGYGCFNITYLIFQANYQSYYKSIMNHIDVGMHTMLAVCSIFTSIFMILDVKTVGFYISLGLGIVGFFAGIFYSRYQLNKKVKTIYTNFKLKEGMGSQTQSGYEGKEGSTSESGSGEESNSQSEQSDQIIDIEPEDKPKKKSKKKRRNDDEEGSESGSESGSGSEENSEEEDEEGSEYEDNENNELFNQIEDIITKVAKNEKLVVFRRACDTDLVCKFVRENQTAEAYQLANKIYKEALSEHQGEVLIYMKYAYFLWYTGKKKSSKHFEPVSTLSQSDLGKDNENEIDHNEPLQYLQEAIDLKPPFTDRYKIQYVLSLMRENKNKKADLSKKSTYESFLGMERTAIHYHMITLQQLKSFFTRVKTSNNQEVQYCQQYLKKLFDLQKNTEYHYQKLISQFPDSKSSIRLYAMFLSGVKNQTKLAAKHLASIGATLDDNGKPHNNVQKSNKAVEDYDEDNEDEDNGQKTNSIMNNKKLKKKGGSMQSLQKSENQSSVSSDRENRKEIVLRNNMLQTFVKSISKCSLLMNILYSAIFILSALLCVSCIVAINNVLTNVSNYRNSSKSMFIISQSSHNVRLMSIAGLAEDETIFNLYKDSLCNTIVPEIDDKLMPFLQGSFSAEASETAVIVQNSDNPNTFTNEHLNAYEVGKRFQTWIINLCDIPYEDWKTKENGETMMNDYRVRFFADNSKENFLKIMKEAYSNEQESYSSNMTVWNLYVYIIIGSIVVFMACFYIFAINPLRYKTKVIFMKVIKMLKFIPNGSFDEIISKFDEDIEVISETYDVSGMENSKSYNKSGDDKNELKKKIKRDRIKNIFLFALIIIVSLMCCIPYLIASINYIVNLDLIFYSSQRASYTYKIHMLSFELFAQDRLSYLPGECERLLSQNVGLYEEIQSNIKSGSYGAKPPQQIPVLNNFLLNGKCYMGNCTADPYYDSKIGYVQDIVTLPLNDLIQENISKVYRLLRETDFSYLNSFQNLFAENINKEKAAALIEAIRTDEVLKFQNLTMNHIVSGLQEFDVLLLDYVDQNTKSSYIFVIILFVLSAIISPYIYFTSLKKMAKNKLVEMEELVNIVFTIPTSTINIVPQYRRFIETSEINDD